MPDVIANKYKIVREIARSNDIVYEAIDSTMGRRLAIKELVLPANLTDQARRERIERFNREARAAGRLSHPNIVTVYDFGEDAGRYFIAMEYLEGCTLRDLLLSRGALPLSEASDIANQILGALTHAHAHKVVHRDVKPDNIHILPGGQIKLTDFGIARLTEEASLTGDGQVFGTPSYMSPEQIEGRYVDHRTDLFSTAVVLYEMLAGRKPFTGDSVVSITYNIMHNDAPPLVGTPFGVEQVIRKALSKDPGRRSSSAEEMARELKNADAMPKMLMPQNQPTGMGYYGQGGANASGFGTSFPGQSGYAPQPQGYPNPTFGSFSPQTAQPQTAYHAPPVAAGGQTAGGQPFVNWGGANPQQVPIGTPPAAPFPRRPPGPILSDSARTFLLVLLWSVVLAGVTVGLVLLFLRAYDENQKKGGSVQIQALQAEGEKLFNKGSLEEAALKFDRAMRLAGVSEAGTTARKNLGVTYNRLGVRAMERRELRKAEEWFNKALDADPEQPNARYNLGKVYDRLGDKDGALREWSKSNDANRAGGTDPGSPGNDDTLNARIAAANTSLSQAEQAYKSGDIETARTLWQKVIEQASGTDLAARAKNMMDQTASGPNF